MLGPLIVCYLFLGGAGAGACFVLAVLGLLAPRELVTVEEVHAASSRTVLRVPEAYRHLLFPGYAVALVVLVVGMTCLVGDIGRIDRLMLLLTNPTVSFVAVGAWSLVICLVMAVLLAAVWSGILRRWRWRAVCVLQVALALVAVTVMVYTGLLLQSLSAVPLWATPWLPVLFVLSSLSCGVALVLVTAQFTDSGRTFATTFGCVAAADAFVVILEAIVAAVFVATALAGIGGDFIEGRTAEALAASAQALVAGESAWLFWGGFVAVGLVVPFVLDLVLVRLRRSCPQVALVAAACVLVGGFLLRFCVVEAGMRPLLAFAAIG